MAVAPPPVKPERGPEPAAVERAAYLLACLRRRGFTVQADGERLVITPGSRLTDGEASEVREYKALLLKLLGMECPPTGWTEDDRAMVRLAISGAFQWWRPGLVDEHMARTGRTNSTEDQHGEDQGEGA